jgi:hypothetical protein
MLRLGPAFITGSLTALLFAGGFSLAGDDAPANDKPASDKPTREQPAADIDWERARNLHQREQRGEKLSPEDQAYLDRAKAIRQKGGGGQQPGGQQAGRQAPSESTGFTPLTDFKPDQKYKGEDGGLYGNNSNEPPAALRKAADNAASQIVPRDAKGKPSPDGKIALMSIGMSNTTQEFSRFIQIANADKEKSPSVVLVDGAQGGQAAEEWVNKIDNGTNSVWDQADHRLASAGVTAEQVQVIWIKQALKGQGRFGAFPEHAKVLQKDLAAILTLAKKRFPNLQIAYLSSRIYGGYAAGELNPEPYAYEGAFSIRWVIDDQQKGNPDLNYDPAKGDVKAPLALWGPYLWADGTKGRAIDKLVYTRQDLGPDGTHPSPTGRDKVADLLLNFLKTDPTAKPWFVAHAPAAK